MRRRQFVAGLVTAATWPLAAGAQQMEQQGTPLIGFLCSRSSADAPSIVGPFLHGLNETAYIEGQNVLIEYQWAENQFDRLPALAAELVGRKVNVIAALAAAAPALAAKKATSVIPIVFQTGSDPVSDGLVSTLNRPGGNVTGVSPLAVDLGPKRLERLLELVPHATVVGLLVNPTNRIAELQEREMREPVGTRGRNLIVLKASTRPDLENAFQTARQERVGALLVANDPLFFSQRELIIALAARHAIPVNYADRADAIAGGPMSYAASLSDSFRQVGIYVGRILRGEKAAELPVARPTKFELVINLTTARALGLAVPQTLLAAADEVIE